MTDSSSICRAQYDAVLLIKTANDKLQTNYENKYDTYLKNFQDWKLKHNQWIQDRDTYTHLVSNSSPNWIELDGSAFNCASLKEDSILCCKSHNLKRKKCTLQKKGGTVKCSNTGACAWPLASTSCCSGKCHDIDANYCKNASIVDESLPISESQWELDGKKYPEPIEPIKPDPVVFQQFPFLNCQDCSTYIQTLDSEDVTMNDIVQTSKCIANLNGSSNLNGSINNYSESEIESESSSSLLANFSENNQQNNNNFQQNNNNSQQNNNNSFDFSQLFDSLLKIIIALFIMIVVIWILSMIFSSNDSNRNITTRYNN